MLPVTELLRELVRIPSPSGQERAAADFCADLLARAGFDVERPGGVSVLARASRAHGPRLFLNSHVDVVPPGAGWDRDPWDAHWHEGRLCGRGANDAKASVAAMIVSAAQALRSAAFEGTLWVGLTACEETTNAGMAAILEHTGLPDGAVTGEPTGLEVVRAQAGLGVIEARWTGRSCHAAHVARVEHESALHEAVRELSALSDYHLLPGRHPLLGASTLVATVLGSGEVHNRVPDAAEAVFDARLAPPHTAEECRQWLAERLPRAEVRVRSDRLRPVETAAGHPLVAAALECAGRDAAVGSTTMSDMALLGAVPAIKCGPGQTARSHTPNEFVLAHEVEAGERFYRALIPSALAALEVARA